MSEVERYTLRDKYAYKPTDDGAAAKREKSENI